MNSRVAEKPRLGAGLVAELRLDLVPDLRELAIGEELGGEEGEDLLVGHAEGVVGAPAVDEPEHLLAHDAPSVPTAATARRDAERGGGSAGLRWRPSRRR